MTALAHLDTSADAILPAHVTEKRGDPNERSIIILARNIGVQIVKMILVMAVLAVTMSAADAQEQSRMIGDWFVKTEKDPLADNFHQLNQ